MNSTHKFSTLRSSLLAAAAAVLLLAGSCTPPPGARSGGTQESRVLLIGLDGFEWSTAIELLAAGDLPNIAALMRDGVYGNLAVTKPTLSPIIWTSIATGVMSDRHGVDGFIKPRTTDSPDDEHKRLYTSADRRVKAFWNIASEAGLKNVTIGWWLTYPAEPVNGVMVAQVNTVTPKARKAGTGIMKGAIVDDLEGQVHPADYQAAILAAIPRVEQRIPELTAELFGKRIRLSPGFQALFDQSTWAFRADAIYHEVALEVLEDHPDFDLFAVYFGGSDVVGHRFWRFAYPELYASTTTEGQRAKLGRIIASYYKYLDRLIGELISAAPDDTTVMLVSDHGMGAVRTDIKPLGAALSGGHLHAPHAFFAARGPLVKAGSGTLDAGALSAPDLPVVGSILDVTPTVLGMLGAPVGRDMDGRVMKELLAPGLVERGFRYVDTHTPEGWKSATASRADARGSNDERIEQLRQLGYLD